MTSENKDTHPESTLPSPTTFQPINKGGSTSGITPEQSLVTNPSIEELQAKYDAKKRELMAWTAEVESLISEKRKIDEASVLWQAVEGVVLDRTSKIADARDEMESASDSEPEQGATDAVELQTSPSALVKEIDPESHSDDRAGLMSYLRKEIDASDEEGMFPNRDALKIVLNQLEGWESDDCTPVKMQIATLESRIDERESVLKDARATRLRNFKDLLGRRTGEHICESFKKRAAQAPFSTYVSEISDQFADLSQSLFLALGPAEGSKVQCEETLICIAAKLKKAYSEDTAGINAAMDDTEQGAGEQ